MGGIWSGYNSINNMSVKVGNLHRKRKVKKMNGELFEWYDETLENPWVIKKGRVVQPEIIEEERKKQIQKQKDTQAIANAQKEMTKEPEDRVSKLEKKVEEQDNKLDKILEKLS